MFGMFRGSNGLVAFYQEPLAEGKAIAARRQGCPRFVRLGLIPEGDARHEVVPLDEAVELSIREHLRTFMLNFDPERFLEHDGVGNMKTIRRAAVSSVVTFPE